MDAGKAFQTTVISCVKEEIIEESKFMWTIENANKITKDVVSEKIKFKFIDAEWWMTLSKNPGLGENVMSAKIVISPLSGRVGDFEKFKVQFKSTRPGSDDLKFEVIMENYTACAVSVYKTVTKNVQIDMSVAIMRYQDSDPHISSKFYNSAKLHQNFIDTLSKMREDSAFSDFTFIVKGKEFKIHKILLAASSSVFARLFTSDMQVSRDKICIVDNIDPAIFEIVLEFIYEAKLPENFSKIAQDIYEAADYYDITELKEVCAKEIHSQLSKVNAVELYNWAYIYDNLKELKQDSWKIVKRDVLHIYERIKDEPISPESLKHLIEEQIRHQLYLDNIIDKKYQIFVRIWTGKSITLEVESSDTIATVKAKIKDKVEIESHLYYLCFAGNILSHSHTLSDYNIQKDSTIQMNIRLYPQRKKHFKDQTLPFIDLKML